MSTKINKNVAGLWLSVARREFEPRSWRGVLDTTLYDIDITEMLLKVALNTKTRNLTLYIVSTRINNKNATCLWFSVLPE